MRLVHRMCGLLDDVAEQFIEGSNRKDAEKQDDEQ